MKMPWLLAAIVPLLLATPTAQGTPVPDASPAATPAVFVGCEHLGAYFELVLGTMDENEGYRRVRENQTGVFGLPAAEAEAIASSLDGLIAELEAISPPEPAAAWHAANLDIVRWYRDLARAEDAAAYQRIVNEDRRLVPALSRATLAGQSACGFDTWGAAFNR